MARKVKEFEIKEFNFLSELFKQTPAFNEVDWVVAEYLFSLEAVRKNKRTNGVEVKEYCYGSLENICKQTGIKAKQTVMKSLRKLEYMEVIQIEHSKSSFISNRYYINPKYMINKDETKLEPSSTLIPNDMINLIQELINKVDKLEKQNQELIKEIKEMKQSENNSEIIKEEETVPKVEVIEAPSNIEVRSFDFDYMPQEFREDYEATKREEAEEFDDFISSIEQATIQEERDIKEVATENKTFNYTEWNQRMEEKYKQWSYIYDKPLSKLNSDKMLMNEINYRKDNGKPLYDLEVRLKAYESKIIV